MPAAGDPPFQSIGVVGLGLVGGSVARGARRAWSNVRLVGVDTADVTRQAIERGVIDGAQATVGALDACDLVVLAAPVTAILSLLPEASRLSSVVTDVGSTKRAIVTRAAGSRLARFVGGHPMAGSERHGLAHATADLFDGRPWLLTTDHASAADIDRLEAFARGLGAKPQRMTAEAHDRLVAYVSHLPQILAQTLAIVAGREVGEAGLASSGRGFADMTRLAGSTFDVWQGILETNADFVAEAARKLGHALPVEAAALANRETMAAFFSESAEWRKQAVTVTSR